MALYVIVCESCRGGLFFKENKNVFVFFLKKLLFLLMYSSLSSESPCIPHFNCGS